MKILLSTDPEIPVPPKIYGGAERVAYNLIKGFKAHGHTLVLLANPETPSGSADKVVGWKRLSSVGTKNIIANSIQLLKVIRAEDPDIVISFSRILYLYPSWLLTRKKFIKRYGRFISPKSNRLANIILGKRVNYTPNAEHMIAHLPEKHKYTPIYSTVDTEYFCDNINLKKEFLLFIGRIEHIKGTREAVQAALQSGVKLVVAGNVPEEHQPYYDEYVRPFEQVGSVEYVGPVDNQQKKELMQRAIAVLQPFNLFSEAFPSTAIESLACGTPLIAFDIPALKEAVIDGQNGYITSTVEEMAAAVDKARRLDRHFIRQDAIERFSIEKTSNDYINLIKQILEN